jgi:hypothetical protein
MAAKMLRAIEDGTSTMRVRANIAGVALGWLVLCGSAGPAHAYAVLTHQAIVDALWDGPIHVVLVQRFPDATAEQLAAAHAYAYGGCIIQDLGYYPFGSHFFSDLLHYVRSADFLQALLDESRDLNEYAFALGALSHYGADTDGHALAINPTVPILYPKLRRKFGNIVTYGDDPSSHLKTEFGFDVLQVARGHYASTNYHDFVGFAVSKELIERAFVDTYGIQISSFYPKFDLSLKTYRYSVNKIIPEMTKAAWAAKRSEIQKSDPGISQQKFLYNLRQSAFEKEWGGDYQKPGLGARFLALVFRLVPKVGPFRSLGFRVPPAEAEHMFETSFDAAVARNRLSYSEAGVGILKIANRDLDTGKRTSAGEYELTDRTYDALLAKLAAAGFRGTSPDLRSNILAFYGQMKSPDRHGMAPDVEALRATPGTN